MKISQEGVGTAQLVEQRTVIRELKYCEDFSRGGWDSSVGRAMDSDRRVIVL